MILVNKADGDLKATAERTRADYAGALHLLRKRGQDPDGFPKALAVSALEEAGLEKAWEEIAKLDAWRRDNGVRDAKRRQQNVTWFRAEVEERLLRRFRRTPEVAAIWPTLEQAVGEGEELGVVRSDGLRCGAHASSDRLCPRVASTGRPGFLHGL